MIFNFTDNIEPYKKLNKVKRDKINYILSYLHKKPYSDKTIKDGWVNMNAELLKAVMSDYKVYVKMLIEDGFIERGNVYKIGLHSYQFKINYTKINKKGLKSYENKYYTKYVNILKGLNKKKNDDLTQYIIDKTEEMFNKGTVSFGKNEEKAKRLVSSYKKESYDKYYSAKILLDRILAKDITVVSDKMGSRIYSNYHNIPRDLRKLLLINGKQKIGIDLSNSQLQTLSLTIMNKYPELNDNGFYELVFDGKIYDFIVEKTNHKRDDVKRNMLNWLYAETFVSKKKESIKYIDQLMSYYFNEIYIAINLMKSGKNGGEKLAHQMQEKESRIIKRIQGELLKRGVDCISIHDSFYFEEDIDRNVIEWVKGELTKYGYCSVKEEVDIVKEKESKKVIREVRKEENKRYIKKYLDNKDIYVAKINNNEIINIQKEKEKENLIDKINNLDDYFNKIADDYLKTTNY